MDNAATLERGMTVFGPTQTINTTNYKGVEFEGKEVVLVADDGSPLVGRIMRNVSGGTIYAGSLVKPSTVDLMRKRRFVGVTDSAACEAAGVVDDKLPATGCRNGDLCIVFYKGLHKVSISDAQAVNISVGQVLIAQDEGQASTVHVDNATTSSSLVFTTDDTTGEVETGYAALCLVNKIGRAAVAVDYDSATAGVDTLQYVDLNIQT